MLMVTNRCRGKNSRVISLMKDLIIYFRLYIECVLMPPQASRGQVVTKPAIGSDVEAGGHRRQLPHRRPQKLCTTERLPAVFAWALLLIPSFTYWIWIFPEIIDLLPKLFAIMILHCILFIVLCANFIIATFMDPVSDRNRISFAIVLMICRVSTNNCRRKNRQRLVIMFDQRNAKERSILMMMKTIMNHQHVR